MTAYGKSDVIFSSRSGSSRMSIAGPAYVALSPGKRMSMALPYRRLLEETYVTLPDAAIPWTAQRAFC
jgi:hypothetical protein